MVGPLRSVTCYGFLGLLAAGSRQQAAGSRQQAAGSKQQAAQGTLKEPSRNPQGTLKEPSRAPLKKLEAELLKKRWFLLLFGILEAKLMKKHWFYCVFEAWGPKSISFVVFLKPWTRKTLFF